MQETNFEMIDCNKTSSLATRFEEQGALFTNRMYYLIIHFNYIFSSSIGCIITIH